MLVLVLGLVIFFAPHTFTMLREPRAAAIARLGENPYKGLYSLVALVGLILIIWGYGLYRSGGYVPVWDPPAWTRHLAMLLLIPVFPLFIATYAPGEIKRRAKHPTLVAVKLWALAHLLVNGDLGSILLFGAFLVWAVVDRIAVKRRAGQTNPLVPGSRTNDIIAVIGGLAIYFAFVFYLHGVLIGVPVLPG